MKNPKLIVKPFAKNGQKNVIPENYETSMDSNQATWDQGFGQITMLPVASGGLPPKGQDFNGILNQISENIVYQSQGGRFKFSPEYAESIGGYPKGAILQSDDEKKDYQSLIDNNKVNFNTESNISESWELIGSKYAIKNEVDLALMKKFDKENISGALGNANDKVPSLNLLATELGKKQPIGNYAPEGDYATNTALTNGLALKFDKTDVTQTTGTSTTKVMSQDAATKAFMKPGDFGIGLSLNHKNYITDYDRTDIPAGFYTVRAGSNQGTAPPIASTLFGFNLLVSIYGEGSFITQTAFFYSDAKSETYRRGFAKDSWSPWIKLLNENDIKQSLGTSGSALVSQKVVTDHAVPVGTIIMLAHNNQPAGRYLKANGALAARASYQELFAAIGTMYGAGDGSSTFQLPNVSDEFPRFASDSRDVGSKQLDQYQAHGHELRYTAKEITGSVWGMIAVNRSGGSKPSEEKTHWFANESIETTGGVPRDGSETRPRNIALSGWIKY